MEYIATYHTDVGTRKETNQDSLAIKVVNTKEGNVAFAIVCDGMGGLAKGEVASKEVIEAFCTIISNKFMNTVRDIRNASAHSNCLINKLFEELPATQQPDAEIKDDWSYDKTGRLYFFGV